MGGSLRVCISSAKQDMMKMKEELTDDRQTNRTRWNSISSAILKSSKEVLLEILEVNKDGRHRRSEDDCLERGEDRDELRHGFSEFL